MSLTLRPYQEKIISDTRNLMRQGYKRILIQSPVASGKTCVSSYMNSMCAQKKQESLFLVNRVELCRQTAETFDMINLPYGIISAGFSPTKALTQIASVQTLVRRKIDINPTLIVIDEAHHTVARTWEKILDRYPNAFVVGITASACRTDGAGLGKWFQEMVLGPSVADLIEQGYLSKFKYYAPSEIDVSGLHVRMGDFKQEETTNLMDKPTITGCALEHYKRLADGKRALIFCTGIKHSKNVCAQFQAAGYSAIHLDGETPADIRENSMRLFKEGKIQIITSVNIFAEGLDVQAIECIILLRPTCSLGLYIQMTGRGLRSFLEKKECIILDHASNCHRFGLIDEEREWSLDSKPRRKKSTDTGPPVRRCPRCFACQKPANTHCLYCGFEFEIQQRDIDFIEGNLQEVDPAVVKQHRRNEQGQARTLYDLIQLGMRRGMKNPAGWASHVIKARNAKKQRQGY